MRHASAVEGIDEAEAVEPAGGDFVERNLPRREKVVAPQIELEAERLPFVEAPGVVGRQVVALVAQRIDERPVGARAFVGDEGSAGLSFGL